MAEGVSGRLRSAGVRASTIAVKIRDSSFRTITRQRTLPEPTDLTEPIFRVALDLARPEVRGAPFEVDQEPPTDDVEEFILGVVLVPVVFALHDPEPND